MLLKLGWWTTVGLFHQTMGETPHWNFIVTCKKVLPNSYTKAQCFEELLMKCCHLKHCISTGRGVLKYLGTWCIKLLVWEQLSHSLNHWLSTWEKDLVSPGSTGEGNSSVWPEGVEPGCISLKPHLRADCHWRWISYWRSLFGGAFSCKPGLFWYR